jgi:outer membrane protein assembly factor BamB
MACRLIWSVALCAFVIAAAQMTTPALATPRAALTLVPAVGPPTASTTVSGTGYAGREVVAVRFDGVHVGSAVAGAAGRFSLDVTVPSSALPGFHSVEAIGETSGSSARAPFHVRTDWLQGCFDAARRCSNPYENVIAPAGAGALAPAWRTAVGTDGRSGPVYANGRLFVATDSGLLELDPATGAIIINDHSGPVSATPAVIRGFDPQPDPPGKVIFGTRDGTLHALSTSGAPLWQARLSAAPASPVVLQVPGPPARGSSSAPATGCSRSTATASGSGPRCSRAATSPRPPPSSPPRRSRSA